MKKLTIDYSFIENDAPKAWLDFVKFYKEEFKDYTFLRSVEVTQLPFEMQLGVFLKYFNDNGVELDLSNTEYSQLPENVTEAFITHEKVISHFS